MSRSLRIEELLCRPYSPAIETGRQHALGWQDNPPRVRPKAYPELVVKTSPTSLRQARAVVPMVDRFSWEFNKKELASPDRARKRKSPVDDEVPPLKRAVRLPRYSANIIHPEPLHVFPIPFKGCVPRMMKYYLQVWAPQHGRGLSFEGHPQPYESLVFPHALQHAVLFEALIALSQASWLLQEGYSWLHDSALAYHRANAFAALRVRLESDKTCADDTTIMSIAALTTIDYMLGIHEGAENHVDAMTRIQSIRTDLRGDTPWQYFIMSTMKAYGALWTFIKDRNKATTAKSPLKVGSPVRTDLLFYPSLPFNMKVCEALSKISPAFNDIAIAGEMSIQVIEILAALSTIIKNDPRQLSSPSPSPSPGWPSRLRFNSPGSDDLLDTIAELRHFSNMATTPTDYRLCFGAGGCCFTLHFGGGTIGPEFDDVLQELEDTLDGDGKPRTKQEEGHRLQTHTECIIWASIAAAGALEMSESFSATTTMLDRTLNKFPVETGSWATLEKILRRFLWNETLGNHWKRCWQKAMRRQPRTR